MGAEYRISAVLPGLLLVAMLGLGSGCALMDALQEVEAESKDAGPQEEDTGDDGDTDEGDTDEIDPPQVEIGSGPPSVTNSPVAEFEFECLDGRSCEFTCQLNEEEAEPCESPTEYDELDDGLYLFEVVAVDDEGLESEPESWEWSVNSGAPDVEIVDGPDEFTNETTATFYFRCLPEEVECDFECSFDGGFAVDCSPGVSYDGLDDGEYVFEVFATDELGNTGSSEEWGWTVDTVDPILTIEDQPPEQIIEDNVVIEFGCDDGSECTFECALEVDDGGDSPQPGDWEECNSPLDIDELEPGSYTLWVRATDRAGNQVEESVQWDVIAWAMVDTHYHHSCGLRSDGVLWCWGEGDYGRLGNSYEASQTVPQKVLGEEGTVWEYVSAGRLHTCGVTRDGSLWCWGQGSAGRLGIGKGTNSPWTPEQVGESEDWSLVAAGGEHSCGVDEDGTLWCWGRATQGQLGLGSQIEPQYTPAYVDDPMEWKSVRAGSEHSCGLKTEGTLWCWGNNGYGRSGLGGQLGFNTPHQVGDAQDWAEVSTGDHHSCGVRTDGTLWCWGECANGKLGLGEDCEHVQNVPEQVGDAQNWESVSAVHDHTCGVRTDGTLWCWGRGDDGRLGLGEETSNQDEPAQVGGDQDWQSVRVGRDHTCGMRTDRTLWCWGAGDRGQLGLGDESDHSTPQQVEVPVQ